MTETVAAPITEPIDEPIETSYPRLADDPDWLYLLREFEALYRPGLAGGSTLIRAHRKKVRDQLSAVITSNPTILPRELYTKPVVGYLNRAIDIGERGSMIGMSRALRQIRDHLSWEHGYEKVRRGLARKYAYCEILGPNGPIQFEKLILGFVLFAPNTTYPQHAHAGVEESYISIAGSWSENDGAVYAPGSLILNKPGDEHRITTGQVEPCLLAYAWVGPASALAAPGMKFTANKHATIARRAKAAKPKVRDDLI